MDFNRVALPRLILHLGMCTRPAEKVRAAHWPSNHVAEHPVGPDMCLAPQLKSSSKVLTHTKAVSARNPCNGTFKQGWRRVAITNGDVPID
jgi:hypothetical protein